MINYPDKDSNKSVNTVHFLKPLTVEQKARKLESFSVTTDSVVATAHLGVNGSHEIIRIWWGDEGGNDQPQTVDLRKERLTLGNPSPENLLTLQHSYDIELGLRKIISVQTQDNQGRKSWDSTVITLEPRYKFAIYPVRLEINNHLDTIFESDSELEIQVKVTHRDQTVLDEQWKEDITTHVEIGPFFPILYTLDGSRVNLEMIYQDDPVQVEFHVNEVDNVVKDILEFIWESFPTEFDGSAFALPGPFHPRYFTGAKEFRVGHSLDDGIVYFILSTEMNLIVPLDRGPQTVLTST